MALASTTILGFKSHGLMIMFYCLVAQRAFRPLSSVAYQNGDHPDV
jgi:hypothetical protein